MDFAARLDKYSLTCLRDTQAGGVEDVHVLSRRNERHPLAGRRRFSTADLGNEQPAVYATHMGEGGFAKPFDEFDDAFGDERTACPLGKMLRTDTDRQRVADLQRRRRQIEVTQTGAGHARAAALDAFDFRLEEIHRRRADEAGDEQVGGRIIKVERLADLLEAALVHHDNAVGEGYGLDL